MKPTSEILERINKSSMNHPDGVFTRLYRYLLREDIYLAAYQKLYSNNGATTQGTDVDTADGFSKEYVRQLISELADGTYTPKPVRRIYIQKANGKLRPLGIPSFRDKLLQEAIRSILEVIYEPIFVNQSHGFRPKRSVHTALSQMKRSFKGTNWFIEGDIKGCFDNINHAVLIKTLETKIKDSKFVNVIRAFLKAGYVEDFVHHSTISGTPQGGIISPILANIYLHELDKFVAKLKDSFDFPSSGKFTPEYNHVSNEYNRIRRKIKKSSGIERQQAIKELKAVRKIKHTVPAKLSDNKKLVYCRYADDFLIGVCGNQEDCVAIRDSIREFLFINYSLELSMEKTKITHSSKKVRFLGYDVAIRRNQQVKRTKDGRRQRTLNYSVELTTPLEDKIMKYLFKNGVIYQRQNGEIRYCAIPRLTYLSDSGIVSRYNSQIRGICNFYRLAANYNKLNYFRYLMEYSCLKTLASKHRSSSKKMRKKYNLGGKEWGVLYSTKKGTRYLKLAKLDNCKSSKWMEDKDPWVYKPFNVRKSSLIRRLDAGVCELCGSTSDTLKVYHAGKMKNLKSNTEWGRRMIRMRRKTLIVCPKCYKEIHEDKR